MYPSASRSYTRMKKHPGVHYTSDLADELGIDLRVAFAAAERLIAEGRARVREG